jgi:hypothetical protein
MAVSRGLMDLNPIAVCHLRLFALACYKREHLNSVQSPASDALASLAFQLLGGRLLGQHRERFSILEPPRDIAVFRPHRAPPGECPSNL